MLREDNFQGGPLKIVVGSSLEHGTGWPLEVGHAVTILAARGQGQAADDATLAAERLSHQAEAVYSLCRPVGLGGRCTVGDGEMLFGFSGERAKTHPSLRC